MMQLSFFGAAQEVTGSMHILEINGTVIAFDCGLFQGRRAEAASEEPDIPMLSRKRLTR